MPLLEGARDLIRINLEKLQNGEKVALVVIGTLTELQLRIINDERKTYSHPPIEAAVVFVGNHAYRSRIVGDGYTIDDVIDQIESAMHHAAEVLKSSTMTAIQNPNPRADRYGNLVRDRAVFECSVRHPRPELFSVIPKGDCTKPK